MAELTLETLGWSKNCTVEYNKSRWSDGCVQMKLHGKCTGKLSLSVELGEVDMLHSYVEWKAETSNGCYTFPYPYTILNGGSGYVVGDEIKVGNHSAVVDLTQQTNNSIYSLKNVKHGAYDETVEVIGGSGTGAEITFPKSEVDYEDGMTIKVHIRHSSKLKPCVIRFTVGHKTVRSPPFFVVSKGVAVTTRLAKREEKKRKSPSGRSEEKKRKFQIKTSGKKHKLKKKPSKKSASASAADLDFGDLDWSCLGPNLPDLSYHELKDSMDRIEFTIHDRLDDLEKKIGSLVDLMKISSRLSSR